MNCRFDFDIPQALRELHSSNIFYKYKIYFSCLTGVLVELGESQKNLTKIDYDDNQTQTTIRSSLTQDLYLKLEDDSEAHIQFIDSDIKAIKYHLLTVILVRYPDKFDKEFLAVHNHNLNKSFLDRSFNGERWSNFSHSFLKGKSIIDFTSWTMIVSIILIVLFVLISSFLKIHLEIIGFLIYILAAIAIVLMIFLSFVERLNDTLMKQKIHDRLYGILAFLKSQESDSNRVKDTTEFEYIDDWN